MDGYKSQEPDPEWTGTGRNYVPVLQWQYMELKYSCARFS